MSRPSRPSISLVKGALFALFITSVIVGCEAEPVDNLEGDIVAVDAATSTDSAAASGDDVEADTVPSPATPSTPPAPGCLTDVDCDDGLACTGDSCEVSTGQCTWTLNEETCLIGGVCYAEGDVAKDNTCLRCDAVRRPLEWSNAPATTTCDDQNPCTSDDLCSAGVCMGALRDCDDGNDCTVDTCVADSGCSHTALPNGNLCTDGDPCTLGDMCLDGACTPSSLACDDNDPCTIDSCDASDGTCSSAPYDGACDDGDVCTEQDSCASGACIGVPISCEVDAGPCFVGVCDSSVGCVEAVVAGEACDDGDLCTENDVCTEAGSCAGEVSACDDDNPCTADACDADTGCTHTPTTGECDDGDLCTANSICDEGECGSGSEVNCDDGDVCTIDLCDETVGCVHLPTQNACCAGGSSSCDDGNPCTTAECDPVTGGCLFVPNTSACDDGNACTTGDACSPDGCAGTEVICDDQNPCTADQCSPSEGCVHSPLSGDPCDDGIECTTEDMCMQGECVGDAAGCVCVPTFGDALKVNAMAIGENESAGEAADLDGDGEGDNALSLLALFANPEIVSSLEEGSINVIMDMAWSSATTASLATYVGELDPANADCAFQSATCQWQVDPSLLDSDSCEPIAAVPATVTGGSLSAGSPDATFTLSVPLGEAELTLTIVNLLIEGELTVVDGNATAFEGLIGGAVPKAAIVGAIEAAPDEVFPVPKDLVLSLMDGLENDIDTTGDGTLDGLSIGIKVSAIDGVITGTY